MADILQQRGNAITTPTQTGLGERSHLLSESITLSVFVDAQSLASRLTPQPLATFTSELKLEGPVGNGLPASYVSCTDPVYEPTFVGRRRAQQAGWPIIELATGHDAMITAPLATADLLERLSIEMRGT